MTVALYARVSTPEQNTDAQMLELREYAKRRGFEIQREYVDTVTGSEKRKAKDAPAFAELMKDAGRLRFNAVLVWKFDRFARSLRVLVEALQTFSALGIEFVSVTQNIDTTTPGGKLFFHVVAAFAEFEREMIVERTRLGVARAKAKGVEFGRPRDPQMESWVCTLKNQGESVRQIAKITKRSRAGVALILKRAYHKEQA